MFFRTWSQMMNGLTKKRMYVSLKTKGRFRFTKLIFRESYMTSKALCLLYLLLFYILIIFFTCWYHIYKAKWCCDVFVNGKRVSHRHHVSICLSYQSLHDRGVVIFLPIKLFPHHNHILSLLWIFLMHKDTTIWCSLLIHTK